MGLGSLAKRWGFGVEFTFAADTALTAMGTVRHSLAGVRAGMDSLKSGGGAILGGVGGLAAAAAPFVGALGLGLGYASQLSAEFEDQALTFNTLLGDQAKAKDLMADLVSLAATTPFEQSDVLEGGKHLLNITDRNVEKTKELVKLAGTLAAINPGRSLTDAADALIRASQGEFDPLRSFSIGGLGVEQFKKFGKTGGAKFRDAVLEEVGAKVTSLTGGADMLGLLSKTQSGSLSNVKDAFNQILKQIGDEMKPIRMAVQEALIDAFAQLKEPAVAAFHDLLTGVSDEIVAYGGPIRDAISGWWRGLGAGGQAGILKIGMAIAGVISVATIGLGVVAGLVAGVGAFGMIAGGLVSVATGLFTVLSSGWAVVLPLLALAMVAIFAVGGALFSVYELGADGAAYLDATWASLGSTLGALWTRVSAFTHGFREGFLQVLGEVGTEWGSTLKPALLELWASLLQLSDAFGMGGTTGKDFATVGRLAAFVVTRLLIPGLQMGAYALTTAAREAAGVARVLAVAVTWARSLSVALFGLSDGTLSFREAVQLMALRTVEIMGTMMRKLVSLLLGGVDAALAGIQSVAAMLPGGGPLAEIIGQSREGLGLIGGKIDEQLGQAIAGFDAAGKRIEDQRLLRTPRKVSLDGPIVVNATIQADTREIGKAQAKSAIDDGEAGKKRRMPPEQRGRVLRNGLEITPLLAAEVL